MGDDILRNGSRGEQVQKLQQDLNALGFGIAVDGIFGSGTEKAVKSLQASFGYTVDGLVGKGTQFLIEQQKTLQWRAGMPTSAVPASTTAAPPPAPAAAPTPQAPVGKGPLGNKTPMR